MIEKIVLSEMKMLGHDGRGRCCGRGSPWCRNVTFIVRTANQTEEDESRDKSAPGE